MNLIVAVDDNWGIGYDGKIQWNIKEDMAFFKDKTLNKVVIMGKKTLDSFKGGKPLAGRTNIVLTRDISFETEDVIVVNSIQQAMNEVGKIDSEDVYIIGGQSVYEAFLPYCKKALITKVHAVYNADKYFPNLDKSDEWEMISKSEQIMTKSGVYITFTEYERTKEKNHK